MRRRFFAAAAALVAVVFGLSAPVSASHYFNGFETDVSGWDVFGGSFDATRVPSGGGTLGVTSASGSWHAESGTAAGNWGGYGGNSGCAATGCAAAAFPANGYDTTIDIYLDVDAGFANDTRFDFSSAINVPGGSHRRDFIFGCGFYNDNDGPGAGTDRFICTASNNAPGWPKNPAREPTVVASTTGWYTFLHEFRDDGFGVLTVDLSVLNSSGTVIKTWTLSEPTDLIGGTTVGGNRYGWFVNNGMGTLAFDNTQRASNASPTMLVVDDDGAGIPGNCDDGAATHMTIGAAEAVANTGDTIFVCPGTYTETSVFIDEEVTIQGSGTGSTILDSGVAGTGIMLYPQADNITIKDLTIQNNLQGVRFELAGMTIDNTEINHVEFLNNASRGIEIHNATTVTNLLVVDSFFDNPNVGIRMASSAEADGITILRSTFQNHSLGFYQANDTSTGHLRDLHVDDSTFTNNSFAAIFAEEIRDSVVENSTFTGNGRGFYIFKAYTGAGVGVENITVRDNDFTDTLAAAVLIVQWPEALGGPIVIENNTMDIDVANRLEDGWGVIDVRLRDPFDHANVTIRGNTLTLSDTSGGASPFTTHAIKVRGGPTDVDILGNTLDGGNVAGGGGSVPTSGFYLVSDDASYGHVAVGDSVDVSGCNTVANFINGMTVHDQVADVPGGLTGGSVTVNGNNIEGNSFEGVDNSGTSQSIDGRGNWWGANTGPGGVWPGTGDSVTANVDVLPFLGFPCDDPDPTTVLIDIVPGSDINAINNDGKGVIPVAILGSTDFDVTTINPESLAFDGMAVAVRGKDKILCHIADVNLDGHDDLVCLFEDEDGFLNEGSGIGTVTGIADLGGFEGSDTINIVP